MIDRYFYLFMMFIIVFAIAIGTNSIYYSILGVVNVINLFIYACWLDDSLEERKEQYNERIF